MKPLRQVLALLGFAVAAIGVTFESTLIGWVAIALLAASLLLRLVSRRREPPTP